MYSEVCNFRQSGGLSYKETLKQVQMAVRAGRDAACVYRSNVQTSSKSHSMAEEIVAEQCPQELYYVAIAAFNMEMWPEASARLSTIGLVAIVQH